MASIIISFIIKLLEIWIDREKANKELKEAFIAFQKALDAHKSLKVHESAKSQRERLKSESP